MARPANPAPGWAVPRALTPPDPMPDVQHDSAAHRFTADVEGGTAELVYERRGDRAAFVHTLVPEPARGQDVGTALVEAGLAWARSQNVAVVPACPFVKAYMDDHPETQDLIAS